MAWSRWAVTVLAMVGAFGGGLFAGVRLRRVERPAWPTGWLRPAAAAVRRGAAADGGAPAPTPFPSQPWAKRAARPPVPRATVARAAAPAAARRSPPVRRPPSAQGRAPRDRAPCVNVSRVDGARRPLFFLHIHKAGGTTFAALAAKNGLCAPVSEDARDAASYFGKNLNPSFRDGPSAVWSDRASMVAYLARKRVDAVATEWFWPTAPPRPPFPGGGAGAVLVASFRDPAALVFSNCGIGAKIAALRACALRPKMANVMTQRLAACEPSWPRALGLDLARCEDAAPAPQQFKPFEAPKKGLLPRHWSRTADAETLERAFNSSTLLAAARRRLALLDVVLVTERLGEAGPVLRGALGWTVVDADRSRAGTHSRAGTEGATASAERADADHEALFAELRRRNANDGLLYADANRAFDRLLRAHANATAR